ncbi:ClpP/crotonase-like domain-containing protein [Paraphysoderma sedebokerense]|nr:ClpP/crotonase-like domain-containing protein [Paraphysoderma sedebokerense]
MAAFNSPPPVDSHFFKLLPPNDYQWKTLELLKMESGKVLIIKFNRPDKFNALSPTAYKEWAYALNLAATDPQVIVTVLTGTGKYYSSGNELSPPSSSQFAQMQQLMEAGKVPNLDDISVSNDASNPDDKGILERAKVTKDLISSLIRFPKLLIAGVNGPAIGFPVTTLALCDIVYAIKEATFQTPFMQLAFCPEGCSSVLFPKILGVSKANEMLFLGRKFSAEEMLQLNFVSAILPSEDFQKQITTMACKISRSLPPISFMTSKRLLKSTEEIEKLEAANHREMQLLIERMLSEECFQKVSQFLAKQAQKSSKKKPKL